MNKNSGFYYIITALWLIAAVVAGHLGLLGSVRPPLIIPVLVLLLVVASFAVPSFRSWLCSISLNSLVAIHLTRFIGFYFLYLYGLGRLPYEFAVYGGWGDIVVAALALILLILSAEGVIKNSGYYFIWNALGLIDTVLALVEPQHVFNVLSTFCLYFRPFSKRDSNFRRPGRGKICHGRHDIVLQSL